MALPKPNPFVFVDIQLFTIFWSFSPPITKPFHSINWPESVQTWLILCLWPNKKITKGLPLTLPDFQNTNPVLKSWISLGWEPLVRFWTWLSSNVRTINSYNENHTQNQPNNRATPIRTVQHWFRLQSSKRVLKISKIFQDRKLTKFSFFFNRKTFKFMSHFKLLKKIVLTIVTTIFGPRWPVVPVASTRVTSGWRQEVSKVMRNEVVGRLMATCHSVGRQGHRTN